MPGQLQIVRGKLLRPLNPEPLVKLIVEQPSARFVGLKPLSVNYELRYGPLPYVTNQFCGCRCIQIDVNFGIDNAVRIQKLLGGPAIPAPGSRIHLHLHNFILNGFAATIESDDSR